MRAAMAAGAPLPFGPIAPAAFAVLARARLDQIDRAQRAAAEGPGGIPHGDYRTAGIAPEAADVAAARPAAVLVPVVARPGGATVLLTLRAAGLSAHPGQIAFPGGRMDPGDDGALGCALREAREEVGLETVSVTPLGALPAYLSGTGYRVSPIVGLVDPAALDHLVLNPGEVDEAFELPLHHLMDPANHALREVAWRGAPRRHWAMEHGDRLVWGVTAGILRALHERLYA